MLRYLVVCAVLLIMMLLKMGNLYTALIGILGLKVSAYAQPLLNKKLFKKNQGGIELTDQEESKEQ